MCACQIILCAASCQRCPLIMQLRWMEVYSFIGPQADSDHGCAGRNLSRLGHCAAECLFLTLNGELFIFSAPGFSPGVAPGGAFISLPSHS